MFSKPKTKFNTVLVTYLVIKVIINASYQKLKTF